MTILRAYISQFRDKKVQPVKTTEKTIDSDIKGLRKTIRDISSFNLNLPDTVETGKLNSSRLEQLKSKKSNLELKASQNFIFK